MRDTFVLLWVGFLIVGVIGSIVSSIRKQAQQQAQPPQDPHRVRIQRIVLRPETVSTASPPSPRPSPPPPPVPPRPPAAARAPTVELAHDFPATRRSGHPVFGSRKAIVQAVIAAEVLGKPRGLRDEYS